MKRVAVLIENHYEELEAWYPYFRLREENIETLYVGTGRETYTGKNGYPAEEEMSIEQTGADEFEGVIIPGGYAPDLMRRNDHMVSFVRECDKQGKLVAAICHAGWVLISAGILSGRDATCFFAIKDDLENAGASYLDKEVVRDKNLVTSRNPFDLPFFCREIITFLNV